MYRIKIGLRSRWGHKQADGTGWERRGIIVAIIKRGFWGPEVVGMLKVPYAPKRAF